MPPSTRMAETMTPLIYILHSGKLYGTEQMALATLQGLGERYAVHLFAPAGPVHAEAKALGIPCTLFSSPWSLLRALFPSFRKAREIRLIATGVSQSLIAHFLAKLCGCQLQHLHIVHGGTDERLSYGRKALLNHLPVQLVAVSRFVEERLLAHGCRRDRISVVENFQTRPAQQQRPPFSKDGIHRVAIVSRADPIKRIGLLLTALERFPELSSLSFDIFGHGSEFETLRQRAEAFPNVCFHGFVPDAAARLNEFDLLLHTCGEEPFGLALLEAMAAGVPILAPNTGGAGSLIKDRRTGFHFAANDPNSLGRALLELRSMPARQLNSVVNNAMLTLAERFSPARGQRDYLKLLEGRPS